MYMSGIREIVSPVHLAAAKPVHWQTIVEMWDYLLEVQFARAEKAFIKTRAMIGISMVSTPADNDSALFEVLPKYLRRPDVVAIGEIGLEPGSGTCKDLAYQEKLVKAQLEIAKREGVCVDFHVPNLPPQKREFTQRILDICGACGMPLNKVAIDHCSDANIDLVLKAGAQAAITVQPFRGMTPSLAAEIIAKNGFERIMIDSDFSGLPSDHLAVPKTALALKRLGVSESDIEKVGALNAKSFYGF
jgi:predicted metal-dependent TIM-barrel fold hydrolase